MNTAKEKDRSRVGSRKTKKVGSPEWCWQTTALAETTFHRAKSSVEDWQLLLDEICKHKVWESIPVDEPYRDRDVWAKEHFGVEFSQLTAAFLKRQAELNTAEAKKEKQQGKRTDRLDGNTIKLDRGSTAENILRRLLREERTEFVEAIKSGEMSVNQAAIAAGYRKKLSEGEKCVRAFRKAENRLEPLKLIVSELEPHEIEVVRDWLTVEIPRR